MEASCVVPVVAAIPAEEELAKKLGKFVYPADFPEERQKGSFSKFFNFLGTYGVLIGSSCKQ